MIATTTPLPARRRTVAAIGLALGLALTGCSGDAGRSTGDATGQVSGAAESSEPEVLGTEPGATISGTAEPLPTPVTPTETLPTATLTPGGAGGAAGGAGGGSGNPDVTYEVRIAGADVTPAPATVTLARGQKLRLVVRADRTTVVHVHGFDVERTVPGGATVPIDLVGGAPGTYVVEAHQPGRLLLQVRVG